MLLLPLVLLLGLPVCLPLLLLSSSSASTSSCVLLEDVRCSAASASAADSAGLAQTLATACCARSFVRCLLAFQPNAPALNPEHNNLQHLRAD